MSNLKDEMKIGWEELIVKQIAKDLLAINARGTMSLHDKIKFIIAHYKEALVRNKELGIKG